MTPSYNTNPNPKDYSLRFSSHLIINKPPNPSLFHSQTFKTKNTNQMAEEFSESEVVFSDHHHHHPPSATKGLYEVAELPQRKNSEAMRCRAGAEKERKTVSSSLPVNIPESMMPRQWEETEDEEEMVPPHVIIGRRITGKMAFSVCTGNGRTLKGRDLSQVRNAILRLTGFLEV